jgi:hypothetical protein
MNQKQLEQLKQNYFGCTYESLGEKSKLLTAVSWYYTLDEVPIHDLLEKLLIIDEEIAKEIKNKGINYVVIAVGEENPYSGHVPDYFYVDCSEWYLDYRPAVKQRIEEIETKEEDKLGILIYEMEEQLGEQIEMFFEKNLGFHPNRV